MDVWIKPEDKPQTGKQYYAYILVYMYDSLHNYHGLEVFIKALKGAYRLKYGGLVPPTIYLEANV